MLVSLTAKYLFLIDYHTHVWGRNETESTTYSCIPSLISCEPSCDYSLWGISKPPPAANRAHGAEIRFNHTTNKKSSTGAVKFWGSTITTVTNNMTFTTKQILSHKTSKELTKYNLKWWSGQAWTCLKNWRKLNVSLEVIRQCWDRRERNHNQHDKRMLKCEYKN